MSRDFILVLGGGVVALMTTFVVLFIMDWVYRRESSTEAPPVVKPKREPAKQLAPARVEPVLPPTPKPAKVEPVSQPAPAPPARVVENPRPVSKPEPLPPDSLPPPETILEAPLKEDRAA